MDSISAFVPFVSTITDAQLATQLYSQCKLMRVSLEAAPRIIEHIGGAALWVDSSLDGADLWMTVESTATQDERVEPFEAFLRQHGIQEIITPERLKKPNEQAVRDVVNSLLDAAAAYSPVRLSVPQLPLSNDASRNRLNRLLASNARAWAARRGYSDKLVLPVVATSPRQVKGKTERGPRLRVVKECFELSGASSVWFAEAAFNDQRVTESYAKRFRSLIDLHQELRDLLPDHAGVVGGPYWGLNLVLWARGLIDAVGISVGSSYQYYLPGGHKSSAKVRVAIPPLLRTVLAAPELRGWLREVASRKKAEGDARYAELIDLTDQWDKLVTLDGAKRQVAEFYRSWIGRLASTPQAGRALSLYQELSRAYVFGAGLPLLEAEEGYAKDPSRVAELLMLVTLG